MRSALILIQINLSFFQKDDCEVILFGDFYRTLYI